MKLFFIILFLFSICSGNGQIDSVSKSSKDSTDLFSTQHFSSKKNNLPVDGILLNDNVNSSHYLLDKWVKGSVVTANNVVIENDSFLFNYDKISNNLLLTVDAKRIIEIDKREF